MEPPLVSVVIPAFNAAGPLAEALESVLAQDPPPRQVVVVDDGSTDETPATVRGYGERVEYVRQPNRGPSAARNAGLAHLRTDAVMFLDADDLLLPGALARRAALLQEGGAAWGYTEGFLQGGTGARRLFSEAYPPPPGGRGGRIFARLLLRNFITTSAAIVRRAALDAAGGFDESLRWMEDWDLWLRLAGRHPVRYEPAPTFVQRQRPASLSSDRPAMARARPHILVQTYRRFPQEVWAAGAAARRSVADAHNSFGYALAREGRWDEALPFLRASLRLWPWQGRAWGLFLQCARRPRRPAATAGG